MLEILPHSELRRALLQDRQQALAADAAESVTAAHESLAGKMDVDVVPVVEIAYDGGVRARIGGAEVLHRLIGEDDTPAEGVVRPIALVDLDAGLRQSLAQQDGGCTAPRGRRPGRRFASWLRARLCLYRLHRGCVILRDT